MNYDNYKIPGHVAIIVDGNGRWAQNKGLSRSEGHKAGAERLKKISKYIINNGTKVLSVYLFSTENFKRSDKEVNYLMNLFVDFFNKDFKYYNKENIKVVFSGRKEPLRKDVYEAMQKITKKTEKNTGGIFNICLNYGSHSEIIDATKKIHYDVLENKIKIEDLNEEMFNRYLYQNFEPIDLLIRTSGELRLSNFMLWQNSYAEFYFSKVHFPDFDEIEYDKAIIEYTKRDRRFGGIKIENKNN